LEAKLSCIATAALLDDIRYVHSPIDDTEHGIEGAKFENFIGLSSSFGKMKYVFQGILDEEQMVVRERLPLPWVGQCRKQSWFQPKIRKSQCEEAVQSKTTVFVNDNCWDFFYCELKEGDPSIVDNVQRTFSTLYQGYMQTHEPVFQKHLTVVAHVRRGDSGQRKIGSSFYSNIIRHLIDASGGALHVIIHTDSNVTDRKSLLPELELSYDVTIRDKDSSITSAFNDMVQADIFLASRSSFSNAAALLSRPGRPTLYPLDKTRLGLSSLNGFHILRGKRVIEEFHRTELKWRAVDSDFFGRVVKTARDVKMIGYSGFK
jgi:hypothetical protein